VAAADDFRALPLRCHALLADVPIHDVWVIDLPGGGPGRTMRDVDALAATGRLSSGPRAARALFALRFALGRPLRWDAPRHDTLAVSYLNRLSDDDRARSLVTPGTMRGPFRTLYLFPDESVAEAHNATVHAFLAMALVPREGGYTLYWAVYVEARRAEDPALHGIHRPVPPADRLPGDDPGDANRLGAHLCGVKE
jgi:hypothetical protein